MRLENEMVVKVMARRRIGSVGCIGELDSESCSRS